jgi:F0F1-type ATP synthase assembly protein I
MLILFFLLGAAAGIYNVIRTAMQMNRAAQDGQDEQG